MDTAALGELSKLIRYHILTSTSAAGSGHPTSSLSAVELMVGLMFGEVFRYRLYEPEYHNNDRLIFSKGHASPLFYALWAVAGAFDPKELITLRHFGSPYEGHPTMQFPYTEVPTGSLGQGLSVGVGMALAAKMDGLDFRTYVLLGDSEMAEGSNWEAIQLAAHYKLDNLVGIIDVNRLGQRGETMYGHDLHAYAKRIEAFGWKVIALDGHNLDEIKQAYAEAQEGEDKPVMIVAQTVKGKGISFLEDVNDWHGKVLSESELEKALEELGEIHTEVLGTLLSPTDMPVERGEIEAVSNVNEDYSLSLATRKAYGHTIIQMGAQMPNLMVLDAEVSNSTYAEVFGETYPDRFIESFIAEQNMVGMALGMAACGKLPFVSTFAAFFTRAFDQIRMIGQSNLTINFVGSHAGTSIGEDGGSQMGLEDISMFRSIIGSIVLYPADHVATEKLVPLVSMKNGVGYIRTTRADTKPIYSPDESFEIGGSKTLKESDDDVVTLIGAGITLYECLSAHSYLVNEGVSTRVIDLYSIKPIDVDTLVKACKETRALIVVEDHYPEGGMAEAVRSALVYETTPVHSMAVRKMPRSGKPEELLAYEEIDAAAIVKKVQEILL